MHFEIRFTAKCGFANLKIGTIDWFASITRDNITDTCPFFAHKISGYNFDMINNWCEALVNRVDVCVWMCTYSPYKQMVSFPNAISCAHSNCWRTKAFYCKFYTLAVYSLSVRHLFVALSTFEDQHLFLVWLRPMPMTLGYPAAVTVFNAKSEINLKNIFWTVSRVWLLNAYGQIMKWFKNTNHSNEIEFLFLHSIDILPHHWFDHSRQEVDFSNLKSDFAVEK